MNVVFIILPKRLLKRGVTLTELLTALTILSFIMAPISLMLYSGFNTYYSTSTTISAQEIAQVWMQNILQDLRTKASESTEVDTMDGNRLTIVPGPTDPIIYHFNPDTNEFFRNSVLINTSDPSIILTDFSVTTSQPEGYDSATIKISLEFHPESGNSQIVTGTYRLKPSAGG
jgi:prepilin-type N-terminal cleavage/methylation domain-containing protein